MNTMKFATLSLSLLAAVALTSCDKSAPEAQDEPETKLASCGGHGDCLPTLQFTTDNYGNVTVSTNTTKDHDIALSYIGYVTDGNNMYSDRVIASYSAVSVSSLPGGRLTIPTGQGTCEIQVKLYCKEASSGHYPGINCQTCTGGYSYARKDQNSVGMSNTAGYMGYNMPNITTSSTNPGSALRVLPPFNLSNFTHLRAMVTNYTIRDLSLDHDETRGEVRYFEDINVPIGAAGHTYQIRFYNPNAGGAGYLYIEFQGGRSDVHKWGAVQTSTGTAV